MKQLLAILILLPMFLLAQDVVIPDSIFKAYLVEHDSINTNGDNEIQVTEASAYNQDINVAALGITDLTGIEAFTALKDLTCNKNSLTSIDVSKNTSLIVLNCSSNNLTSLDVSYITGLRFLWCSNNELTSMDVSNNTSLLDFSCHYNQISSLDITNNANLIVFYCNNNKLSSLDARNGSNENMYDIDCYFMGCGIDFNASGNPDLECISVDDIEWSNIYWYNKIDFTITL